jgi:raffinose/stachyose/melibiose transport system substrate-binding protein
MPDLVPRRARRRPLPQPLRGVGCRAAALGAAGLAALLLAACGSSSSSQSSAGASSASSGSAGASAAHPVTLVVQNGDGGETGLLAAYAALNKNFEAAHPGVKIKFVVKSFQDLTSTLKLQLSGSSGVPDVTQDNEGYQSLGELVTDGLVKNLDSIASADDWSARQPESLLALDGKFSTDGKTMGSGSLYGISATGTWVGLYENNALAKQLGITKPPATLSDLEKDLAIAKAHGVLPLQYGSNDQGESSWLISEILMAQSSPQVEVGIVDGDSPTLPSSMTQAASTVRTWAADGYLTPGSAAYSSTQVFNKFVGGQGLFVLSGSWGVPLPGSKSVTSKFSLIQFPMATAGGNAAVASGDLPWSIPTKSAHSQLAAEYINYITSPAANAAWIANGQVGASISSDEMSDVAKDHIAGASADAVSGWLAIVQHGTPAPYLDWSTPTFLTTIGSATQSLVAAKITPSGYTSALQADYGPFTKNRHS